METKPELTEEEKQQESLNKLGELTQELGGLKNSRKKEEEIGIDSNIKTNNNLTKIDLLINEVIEETRILTDKIAFNNTTND